jgi:YHS domain-containing protein
MLRLILLLVLIAFLARAFWRLMDGVVEGLSGAPPARGPRVPARGVQMVRDPVCGTYVVPDRAVALTDGRQQVFFCSAACRDKYRARTS